VTQPQSELCNSAVNEVIQKEEQRQEKDDKEHVDEGGGKGGGDKYKRTNNTVFHVVCMPVVFRKTITIHDENDGGSNYL
jgi:hypothetical protein